MIMRMVHKYLVLFLFSLIFLTSCSTYISSNGKLYCIEEYDKEDFLYYSSYFLTKYKKYKYKIRLTKVVKGDPNVHNLFFRSNTYLNLYIFTNNKNGIVDANEIDIVFQYEHNPYKYKEYKNLKGKLEFDGNNMKINLTITERDSNNIEIVKDFEFNGNYHLDNQCIKQ